MKRQSHILFLAGILLYVLNTGCSTKKDTVAPAPETSTVKDIEGNVYQTVKIGSQWWMAENLKVKTYSNGDPIRKLQDNATDWSADTTGAYCVYDNNASAPGLLYNFYAAGSLKKIAPAGWHIPSDDEWKQLEKQLGMNASEADKDGWRGSNQGDKLKVKGYQAWSSYENEWPTNESGFSATAGSCRLFDGTFGTPGLFATGFWWSLNSVENKACYRYLDYKNSNVFRAYTEKNYGFSIRCVKD